ncbi:MAG UNVERIFIED_CONTAM: hypothetical protein LVQ98_06540 [Rickettsiaceae bacterium]|jgi:hypothetical protein
MSKGHKHKKHNKVYLGTKDNAEKGGLSPAQLDKAKAAETKALAKFHPNATADDKVIDTLLSTVHELYPEQKKFSPDALYGVTKLVIKSAGAEALSASHTASLAFDNHPLLPEVATEVHRVLKQTGQLGQKHISANAITQAALAKLPTNTKVYQVFSPDAAKLAVREALADGYKSLVTNPEVADKVNAAKNTIEEVVTIVEVVKAPDTTHDIAHKSGKIVNAFKAFAALFCITTTKAAIEVAETMMENAVPGLDLDFQENTETMETTNLPPLASASIPVIGAENNLPGMVLVGEHTGIQESHF